MGTIWDAMEKRAHCRTDVAVGIRPNIRPESHVRIVKKQTNKQTWVTDLQRPRRGVSTRDSSQWLWLGSTASGLGGRPGRFIGARKRDDVSDRCSRGRNPTGDRPKARSPPRRASRVGTRAFEEFQPSQRAADDSRPRNGLCLHGDSGPGGGPRRPLWDQPCWPAAGRPAGPTERITTWPLSPGTLNTCACCWVGVAGKARPTQPGALSTGTERVPPHSQGLPAHRRRSAVSGTPGSSGALCPLPGPSLGGPHRAHRSQPICHLLFTADEQRMFSAFLNGSNNNTIL